VPFYVVSKVKERRQPHMNILGLTKTTLLDYPEHVAATIFIGDCNFRCPFCHNKDIVFQNLPPISKDYVLNFLTKRKNILTGVCITGGEPTLNQDLPDFIHQIKQLGYKVKLDTNGTNPQMLKTLIESNLIDYCAMDIKNCKEKYAQTCGIKTLDLTPIEQSITLLKTQTKINYEHRTTITKELHTPSDIQKIAKWLTPTPSYYLQPYKESPGVITPIYTPYTHPEMLHLKTLCQEYILNTYLRGE
jgi:pyruvate formate lyase activating enzyme